MKNVFYQLEVCYQVELFKLWYNNALSTNKSDRKVIHEDSTNCAMCVTRKSYNDFNNFARNFLMLIMVKYIE